MSNKSQDAAASHEGQANVDAVISVQDLVVRFGPKTILSGVNLDVRHGETMVIMGGSGSGKSTLLRRIIGLD